MTPHPELNAVTVSIKRRGFPRSVVNVRVGAEGFELHLVHEAAVAAGQFVAGHYGLYPFAPAVVVD